MSPGLLYLYLRCVWKESPTFIVRARSEELLLEPAVAMRLLEMCWEESSILFYQLMPGTVCIQNDAKPRALTIQSGDTSSCRSKNMPNIFNLFIYKLFPAA